MKVYSIFLLVLFTVLSTSLFAQDTARIKPNGTERKKAEKKYSCPMHPDVTSDKPGTCSKCGMNLTLSPKEKMKMEVMKIYSCPMHPEVTSDKSGVCPKCGMNLTRQKKSKKMKMKKMGC